MSFIKTVFEARVTKITAAFLNSLQDALIRAEVAIEALKTASSAQPDWSQNDPIASGYIKNRTHYEEVTRADVTVSVKHLSDIGEEVAAKIYEQRAGAKYEGGGEEYFYIGDFGVSNGIIPGPIFRVGNERRTLSLTFNVNRFVVNDVAANAAYNNLTVTYQEHSVKVHKLDPKYLPNSKPLILDANLSDYYGGHSEAGDEALEAIKSGRQILVRVPNADGGSNTAIYTPIMMHQLPLNGMYLYLFYLRDEKQDLSSALGLPAGSVVLPTYGEFMMLLSKKYDSNPMES